MGRWETTGGLERFAHLFGQFHRPVSLATSWRECISQPVQLIGQTPRGRETLFRILLQAFKANRLQIPWRLRIDQSRRDWLLVQSLMEGMRHRFPLERRMAC